MQSLVTKCTKEAKLALMILSSGVSPRRVGNRQQKVGDGMRVLEADLYNFKKHVTVNPKIKSGNILKA